MNAARKEFVETKLASCQKLQICRQTDAEIKTINTPIMSRGIKLKTRLPLIGYKYMYS